jgi:hypothetical protein
VREPEVALPDSGNFEQAVDNFSEEFLQEAELVGNKKK